MNKPIEAGCLAIMINAVHSENIGRTVRVIERATEIEEKLFNCKAWMVDGGTRPLAKDHHMMRIDDFDPSCDVVEEDKAVEA